MGICDRGSILKHETSTELFKAIATYRLGPPPPLEIIRGPSRSRWPCDLSRLIFRPYESGPVAWRAGDSPTFRCLWVDPTVTSPATYRHAEQLTSIKKISLDIKAYVPRMTSAHRDASGASIPTKETRPSPQEFATRVQNRALSARLCGNLAPPKAWPDGLCGEKVQNPKRASIDSVRTIRISTP